MRRLIWCLAPVLLIAACGSSSGTSTPGSTGPPQPPSGLRGVPVQNFECSQPAVSAGVSPVAIGGVQAFLLCPLGSPGQPSKAVTVGANDPAFAALVHALSAADVPPTQGAVCPAYADLTQVVLAKTAVHVYEVSIPADACRHYQHDALDALNRARSLNGRP